MKKEYNKSILIYFDISDVKLKYELKDLRIINIFA